VEKRKSIEQALEDGTISFLSISSLRHGFKIINMLTISAIARHTASLATYVRNKMLELKHSNGKNVCMIYGQTSKVNHLKMGPTITFNLKREDDTWFGYREVEKLASLSRIHLRTGCFCNPGACAKYVGLSHSDLVSNFEAGHVCWDGNDVINGKPTGAVRISFGYMSTYEDAEEPPLPCKAFHRSAASSARSQAAVWTTRPILHPLLEGYTDLELSWARRGGSFQQGSFS